MRFSWIFSVSVLPLGSHVCRERKWRFLLEFSSCVFDFCWVLFCSVLGWEATSVRSGGILAVGSHADDVVEIFWRCPLLCIIENLV